MATTCRVTLDMPTKRRLWGESAGYCQNPGCDKFLFDEDSAADFAEMAHIVAASPGGPRDLPLDRKSLQHRAAADNVVVLCANCHTVVDKAPDSYPTDLLLAWKASHAEKVRTAVGTRQFSSRGEARRHIEPLLASNRAIHSRYAQTGDPYATGNAALWQRHARANIIPNNREIQRTLLANPNLLTEEEKKLLAEFGLHLEQFESRHVLSDWTAGTLRFPPEMQEVLRDRTEDEGHE